MEIHTVEDLRASLLELETLMAKCGIELDYEYDPNDPYAWIKDADPKMYRKLTREFKKDQKKKAREEKKRQKEIGRFKLVTSTTPR